MGISPLLPAIKDMGAKELYDFFGKAISSSEAELNKTEGGKIVKDMFNNYFANVKKDSETFLNPPGGQSLLYDLKNAPTKDIARQQAEANAAAMKTAQQYAMGLNKPVIFGPNESHLIRAIKQAGIERNQVHATNVGDIASILFREEDPHSFYKIAKDAQGNTILDAQGVPKRVKTNWRAEAGIRPKSPYEATNPDSLVVRAKEGLGWVFLSRVALPHTMQHLNVALTEGLNPWAKAWADVITNPTKALEFTRSTGAMSEETYRQMLDIAAGRDTFWHKYFHMPGFSWVRKWEIVHAANAGKWSMLNSLKDNSAFADMQLRRLGLDPSSVRLAYNNKDMAALEDYTTRAAYQSADENLFINRGLKTPWSWDKNDAYKTMFLYKSFQYREGKLIKDAIMRSFKSKNPKAIANTLGIIGLAFPIAGKMIAEMESVATGHMPHMPFSSEDKEKQFKPLGHLIGEGNVPGVDFGDDKNINVDDLIDAYGHMAAFGIWYSLYRAVDFRRGTDFMVGPLYSLGADAAYGLLQGLKGNFRPAAKSVLRRLSWPGGIAATNLDKVLDMIEE